MINYRYYIVLSITVLLIYFIISNIQDRNIKKCFYIVSIFVGLILFAIINIKNKAINKTIYNDDNSLLNLECDIDSKQKIQGKEYFKDKKVIIAGLIRDSEHTLSHVKSNIQKIVKNFHDYRVLIVENDSNDNTRKLLLQMAREDPKIIILGCGINVDKCSIKDSSNTDKGIGANRIKKMTKLRNIYLDYINNNEDLQTYDFLICMDMDIIGTIYTLGLLHSGYLFKNNNNIDALGANGIILENYGILLAKFYYDSYAIEMINGEYKFLNSKIFPYPKCSNGLIKVKSCFGGLMIYRLKSLKNKRYRFKMKTRYQAICEHTTLNEQLDNIYINPYMIFTILHNE